MSRNRSSVRDSLASLLVQREGPLTRELLRDPGGFGLGQVPAVRTPDRTTRSVCGYCSTGCGLDLHLQAGHAVNLSPSVEYPVNLGMACPKGWEALSPLDADDRLETPLLRDAAGRLQPVSWSRALEVFRERFGNILETSGGDALAFLSTGQIPSEEMLFLGALARFGMGMHHGDGNTRQCMATAVSAYKECFGFDAPPYTYADFEESDVIVLVGSNLCIAHPILWERVCRNERDPRIVVIDPRRTETAAAATDHFPIRPRSDLAFFYAIANELIRNGGVDDEFVSAHTEGFEDFAAHVSRFTPESIAESTGIAAAETRRLAHMIRSGKRVSFWWTMGVNQGHEATRVAQSLIALSLLTGQIGRPGTGANSITGQCNAMGSRQFSGTSSLFAGRSFASEQDRNEVAEILGVPESRIQRQDGLAYDQILDAAESGRVKGLWVIATNTAHSWIERARMERALAKLDFLVVQDLYATTETAQLADLVLPAAGWGEKEGTFINSERRIGVTKKVRRAPGQALADFQIFRLVAEAFGASACFDRWKTPEDVFASMKSLSRGRFCDFSGIDGYRELDAVGGIQWPHPESAAKEGPPAAERRLFADRVFPTPTKRARFVFEEPQPLPEPVDSAYPLVLITGRGSSSQWHTQTRTAKSAVLRKLSRHDPYCEISPADARSAGITPGDVVVIESRRGRVELQAVVTAAVAKGQVFVPMHYVEANALTLHIVDPVSRQPAYKHCAVRMVRADAGHES